MQSTRVDLQVHEAIACKASQSVPSIQPSAEHGTAPLALTLTGVRRYQLPPESSKPAQPSLEEPQHQWQSMLSQQGPDMPLADCMLRAYQVHDPPSSSFLLAPAASLAKQT